MVVQSANFGEVMSVVVNGSTRFVGSSPSLSFVPGGHLKKFLVRVNTGQLPHVTGIQQSLN